eukprot:TRINITY_DN56764_c0_g1_i1.p1 TRINITY_DN56764_c0_g1~~TRINITY_DN56764_c0_g1_i1.p1  ORF type:complete len:256 (+),score=34.09 TRINITY_DN56764_c0_g1_i1:87-854(+)
MESCVPSILRFRSSRVDKHAEGVEKEPRSPSFASASGLCDFDFNRQWPWFAGTLLVILQLAAAAGCFECAVTTQTCVVVFLQVLFMGYGYLDAFFSGELNWSRLHISAILDHDRRALLGGMLSIVVGPAVVSLEAARDMPHEHPRLALAFVVGYGILMTCVVRESACFVLHAGGACVGFGASVLLVWLCAINQPEHNLRVGILMTGLLSLVCVLTGILQFLKIAGMLKFPSGALALGECAIVACWGAAIAQFGLE